MPSIIITQILDSNTGHKNLNRADIFQDRNMQDDENYYSTMNISDHIIHNNFAILFKVLAKDYSIKDFSVFYHHFSHFS